jgi:hypothetical protein
LLLLLLLLLLPLLLLLLLLLLLFRLLLLLLSAPPSDPALRCKGEKGKRREEGTAEREGKERDYYWSREGGRGRRGQERRTRKNRGKK